MIGSTLHALPLELIARVGRCVRTQPSPHPTPALLFSRAGRAEHPCVVLYADHSVRAPGRLAGCRALPGRAGQEGGGRSAPRGMRSRHKGGRSQYRLQYWASMQSQKVQSNDIRLSTHDPMHSSITFRHRTHTHLHLEVTHPAHACARLLLRVAVVARRACGQHACESHAACLPAFLSLKLTFLSLKLTFLGP